MVPPCSDRISRVPPYSRTEGDPYPYGAVTHFGATFQNASGSSQSAAGLVRVRSPLLTESRLMSFPPVTEMFQFTGFASRGYGFTTRCRRSGGLPHSEIPGSKPARGSPGLIAACYVLHRLSTPRHPPNALLALEPRDSMHRRQPAHSPRDLSPSDHARAAPPRGRSGPARHQTSSRCQTAAPPFGGARPYFPSQTENAAAAPPWARRLVEANGIEPMTSCLQSRRSPD